MGRESSATRYRNHTSMYVDVRDYGAKGDGISDDTIFVQAAIDDASTLYSGGTVFFEEGTYLVQTLTMRSFVHLIGSGIEATVLKLKSGTNADLVQGANAPSLINISGANGTGSTGGIANWSIQDITLDGNKANQTAGPSYPLRAYGYGFILHNLRIRNGYSGGILADWNGGSSSPGFDAMSAAISNFKIHDCNGIGLEWGGPHDSYFVNGEIFKSGSHNIHIGPNASAMVFTNVHSWGSATGVSAVGFLVESGYALFNGCESEGSDTAQVVFLCNESFWDGGHIFGAGVFNTSGVIFGQANGATAWPSQVQANTGITCSGVRIDSIFSRLEGTNGALVFANDAGNNYINGTFYLNNANALIYTGTINPMTDFQFNIHSASLPVPDGSIAKGGGYKLVAKANSAFTVGDRVNDIFNISTFSKFVQLPNGTNMRLYSDAYTTRTVDVGPNGTISLQQSSTAPDPGAGGTINTGVGVARVSPAAARTGIILQAGTQAGQMCMVINEAASANSITFAASSSNVSGGSSVVIAGGAKQIFVWDSSVSLWF